MTGPTRAFGAEAKACQMAFVSQNVPDIGSDCGVVSPVAPLASHTFATSGGFERFQRFSADQATPEGGGKQEEDIRSYMGEFPVPRLIDAPTASTFLIVEYAPGIIGRKLLALCFQFVDLAARARLMSINPTRLQEPRAADLPALCIEHDCCD